MKVVPKKNKTLIHYMKIYENFLGWKIYLIFLFASSVALTEGFGIIMLMPLLKKLDSGVTHGVDEATTSNILSFTDIDFWQFGISESSALLLIAVAFALKGVFSFLALSFNGRLRGRLQYILLDQMVDSIQESKFSFFQRKKAGSLVNILNEQTSRAIQAFHFIEKISALIVMSFIYICLAFILNWKFGATVLLIGTLVFVFFRWINTYVSKLSYNLTKKAGIFSGFAVEFIQGFKYITATARTHSIRKMLSKSSKELSANTAKLAKMAGFTQSFREPITIILIVTLIYTQLIFFEENFAPIIVASLLLYRTMNSLLAIQANWQGILEFSGGIEIICKSLKEFRQNKDNWSGTLAKIDNPDISINNLTFSYGDKPNLNNLNIKIPFGKSIAMVGTSGAGKTTFSDIVSLLYKANSGDFLVNGISIEDVDVQSWRSSLGYVAQDVIIFSDTIGNNISMNLSTTNNKIDCIKDIEFAAKKAHIHEFIRSLPEGYSTKVGENGISLSGGQKQRLAIAREIFRKPNVLILDEATSALDSETENLIGESIDQLKGEMTIIVIAHRLSTVKLVDEIYVLEEGEVVEQGNFEKLANLKKGKFSTLMMAQLGSEHPKGNNRK